MILLILIAIAMVTAIAATVHAVRVDGYGRVPTDPSRVPQRD